jgi:hypothetical protein
MGRRVNRVEKVVLVVCFSLSVGGLAVGACDLPWLSIDSSQEGVILSGIAENAPTVTAKTWTARVGIHWNDGLLVTPTGAPLTLDRDATEKGHGSHNIHARVSTFHEPDRVANSITVAVKNWI